jgi:hypothetical protein
MAQTQTLQVKIDAAINAEATLKTLRELKQLQKETVAGSADYKKIQARINDIGDAAKTAKGQSEDWIDALAGAGGPIGMLGRGLDTITSSTNKFGLALKATGIGLIVALVGQLVAAFSQNEKAMKKLEPVMIAFEQILGGIFAALEPVFDLFVDLVMWVMPGLQKAIGGLYTAFAALGSFLKNFIVVQVKNFMSFGKILKGVFTLDWDTIKEGFNDVANNIKEGVKNVVDTTTGTWNRYNEGLKETTKTQKKNLEEQNKNATDAANKQKEQIEGLLKLREADLAKQKAIALDAAKTEGERLKIEKKFAEDTFNAKKKSLEDIQALYPKGSKEYKDYTSQLTALDAEYITKKTEFRNKDKEQEKKDFDDSVKLAQDANKRKVDDLTTTFNLQKEKYGENSKEARAAQDAIFEAQAQGLENEKKLYESKNELTKEEKARLEDIKVAQTNLTTTVQIENEKRIKSDRDTISKRLDDEKKASDEKFSRDMQNAGLNFELQQQILQDKLRADEEYFAAQEALYAGNKEKLNEIDALRLSSQATYAQQEEEIRQKQVQLNIQAADAAINALGAETAAGKAALVAKSFLLAKELVLEVKRTIAFSKLSLAESKVAVATGAAKTAKVGFPQNIPLLILYAAQAVSIIKTVIDATKMAGEAGSAGGSTDVGSVPTGTAVPKPRGMATGGLVQGVGGPKSDMIPAMLSNGESVINAQSTSMFRPLLSSINEIGGGRRFAEGGLSVGSFSQDQTLSQLQTMMNTQQVPIKTYVVASDMSNQQMMDRNIKTRSTL